MQSRPWRPAATSRPRRAWWELQPSHHGSSGAGSRSRSSAWRSSRLSSAPSSAAAKAGSATASAAAGVGQLAVAGQRAAEHGAPAVGVGRAQRRREGDDLGGRHERRRGARVVERDGAALVVQRGVERGGSELPRARAASATAALPGGESWTAQLASGASGSPSSPRGASRCAREPEREHLSGETSIAATLPAPPERATHARKRRDSPGGVRLDQRESAGRDQRISVRRRASATGFSSRGVRSPGGTGGERLLGGGVVLLADPAAGERGGGDAVGRERRSPARRGGAASAPPAPRPSARSCARRRAARRRRRSRRSG